MYSLVKVKHVAPLRSFNEVVTCVILSKVTLLAFHYMHLMWYTSTDFYVNFCLEERLSILTSFAYIIYKLADVDY